MWSKLHRNSDMIKARYPVSCACYWLMHIVNFFSSFFIFVNNTLQIMKKFIWVYDHWSVIIKIKSNTYIFFGFYQVNWFSMNTLLYVCHRVFKSKTKIALLLSLISGHLLNEKYIIIKQEVYSYNFLLQRTWSMT